MRRLPDSSHDELRMLGRRPLSSDAIRRYGRAYGRLQFLNQTIRPRTLSNVSVDTLTDRIMRRSFEDGGPQDHYDPQFDSVLERWANDQINYLKYYFYRGVERLRTISPYLPSTIAGLGLLVFEGIAYDQPSPVRMAIYAMIVTISVGMLDDPEAKQRQALESIIGQLLRQNDEDEFREAMREEVRRRVHQLKHQYELSS